MRVWLITVGEPLPLPGRSPRLFRTGLLAGALASRGDEVVWWTSTVDHYAKAFFPGDGAPQRLANGVEVRFLAGRLYRRNVSLARLLNHRQIARQFRAEAPTAPRPDVILASFPTIELAEAATSYGRAAGLPVLVDVRDLWPDVLVGAVPRALSPIARVMLTPLEGQARRALRQATGMLAVSPGYLDWALTRAARGATAADAVVPLGYPRLDVSESDLHAARASLAGLGVRFDRRLVWFVGGFGRTYDLLPLIAAARLFREESGVQFVISGDGEDDARYRARALNLPNLVFTGWIDVGAIAAMLEASTLGVAAYAARAPQGLPNKVFEYMAGGLPIVSSLRGETEKLLRERDCGMTYEPGDADSLVAVLRALLGNEPRRRQLASNSRAAFDNAFDCEVTTARIIALLDITARGHG